MRGCKARQSTQRDLGISSTSSNRKSQTEHKVRRESGAGEIEKLAKKLREHEKELFIELFPEMCVAEYFKAIYPFFIVVKSKCLANRKQTIQISNVLISAIEFSFGKRLRGFSVNGTLESFSRLIQICFVSFADDDVL